MSDREGKELRNEFQEFFMISSLPSMRIGLFLTLILFSCFAVFNAIVFPHSQEQLYYNRFWIVSPVMVLSILVTWYKPLYRWLHLTYILNLLICLATMASAYQIHFQWILKNPSACSLSSCWWNNWTEKSGYPAKTGLPSPFISGIY